MRINPVPLFHFARRVPLQVHAFIFGFVFLLGYSLWLGGFSDGALLLQQFALNWRDDGILMGAGAHLTFGFDAPLPVFCVAALSYVLPVAAATVLISALLWGGVCTLVVRLQQALPPRAGVSYHFLPWLLLIGIALEPFFVRQAAWSPQAAFKVLLGLLVLTLVREKRLTLLTGFVAGLLTLSWFEGLVLSIVLGGVLWRRQGWASGFLYILGLALPLGMWAVYALHHFGTLVPVGVYSDIMLYRHTDFGETLVRMSNILGGIFGANFSEGFINISSGLAGLILWIGGCMRWGRRHTVVAVSFWGTLAYVLYFMIVRTQLGAEGFVLPRLLAFVLIVGGLLSLFEALVQHRMPLRFLRYGLLTLWLIAFGATGWHAKMWITYYEGLRAQIGQYIRINNTSPTATVLAREVGSIGRESGLHMLDWYGRTDLRVAAAIRARAGLQVIRIIEGLRPTWVVLSDRDMSNMMANGYNIRRKYDFMQEFEMDTAAPHFLKDNPVYVVFKRR
ncbi:MAG: hypothetical protein GC134_05255 [Proteobacteria bacterium]|nr:hypothetical protein [Pseudomonadota bacterium]